MKRLTALCLLSALLAAGPASAMRARDYVDADQRGKVTLPAELPHTAITMQAPPEPAAEASLVQPEPEPAPKTDAAATPVVSAVPEPSGLAMLACGLLLLLFVPYSRNEEGIAPELVKRPDSSL